MFYGHLTAIRPIQTHLPYKYPMLKMVLYETTKSQLWNCMPADVSCHWKKTSVMVLDSVTSFWRLKDGKKAWQIHVNVCETVKRLVGFLQFNGRKLEEAEDYRCGFVVYYMFE